MVEKAFIKRTWATHNLGQSGQYHSLDNPGPTPIQAGQRVNDGFDVLRVCIAFTRVMTLRKNISTSIRSSTLTGSWLHCEPLTNGR
jgi:hypothetical protein